VNELPDTDLLQVGKVKRNRRYPLIGLPAQLAYEGNRQYLSRQYTDAVLASGGIPTIIPLLEDSDPIGELVGLLDGIILTGSASDVDPARYGARREERCGTVHPLRDQTDSLLLERARKRRTPLLAICYGIQSLNVFMGGTLIQDIPSAVHSSVQHGKPSQTGQPAHEIQILPGSLLEEAVGVLRMQVNSTHHQAINRVGSGLKAIAHAPDGIIEAVAGTDTDQWILGVQWHPEKCYADDRCSRIIFDLFISQCRAA
jgi:putative glutamine amidotransferase